MSEPHLCQADTCRQQCKDSPATPSPAAVITRICSLTGPLMQGVVGVRTSVGSTRDQKPWGAQPGSRSLRTTVSVPPHPLFVGWFALTDVH